MKATLRNVTEKTEVFDNSFKHLTDLFMQIVSGMESVEAKSQEIEGSASGMDETMQHRRNYGTHCRIRHSGG